MSIVRFVVRKLDHHWNDNYKWAVVDKEKPDEYFQLFTNRSIARSVARNHNYPDSVRDDSTSST
jgi:hypothetical protein